MSKHTYRPQHLKCWPRLLSMAASSSCKFFFHVAQGILQALNTTFQVYHYNHTPGLHAILP